MRDPSPIELAFWETALPRIPNLQREVQIGPFRVDFLVPNKKVVVELYGYAYHSGKEKQTQDAQRERYLQKLGYQVVRFTGQDVHRNVDKCVDDVLAILATVNENPTTASGLVLGQGRAADRAFRSASRPTSSLKVASPPRAQRNKSGLQAEQWVVIGALGLVLTLTMGVFALMAIRLNLFAQLEPVGTLVPTLALVPTIILPPTTLADVAPSEPPKPTLILTPIVTLLPTPPLLSADSALRVADCAYYSSFSTWKSVNQPTTLTPPAGAICGIFAFDVSSGETPIIILNDERYTDLGSCAYGCNVYIRAVPVSIDVQGLKKPDASWRVRYYWNSGPPN
jgi:very-short-patch-repair endonuclease